MLGSMVASCGKMVGIVGLAMSLSFHGIGSQTGNGFQSFGIGSQTGYETQSVGIGNQISYKSQSNEFQSGRSGNKTSYYVQSYGVENPISTDYLSYMDQVSNITVGKNVKIVALGEATHGNIELQRLKKDVFEALLNNNGCRNFAIEGDFGGCQKVNDFIWGGAGTAKEAVSEIGFAIYRTQEMVDLVQWMHDYNASVPNNKRLSFYGFDMQRYDNSKEILLEFLNKVDKQKAVNIENSFKDLTDATVYTQDKKRIEAAAEPAKELLSYLKKHKNQFIKKTDKKSYEIAYECAECIRQNIALQSGGVNYQEARDKYMADKVKWIYQFEGKKLLLITGHNGHISRTSVTFYKSMGNYLANQYKDAYFSIGTDCNKGDIRVVNSSGEEVQVHLENTNKLLELVKDLNGNVFYIDMKKAVKNEKLSLILHSAEDMMSVGSTLDKWQEKIKSCYTLKMVPSQAYNGIILLKEVTPTKVFEEE